MNIYDLISRAQKLRKETQLDSVSPDRVGGLHEDTLKYINEFQLLASSPSLHKIYASVSAMQSDKSPKSDLTGKPLKPGQLVVIVPANQTDATAGDVYRYDGPSGNTSAWTFVAKIGAVPADAELSATSTNPPQNKVVTEKLTELESETDGSLLLNLNVAAEKTFTTTGSHSSTIDRIKIFIPAGNKFKVTCNAVEGAVINANVACADGTSYTYNLEQEASLSKDVVSVGLYTSKAGTYTFKIVALQPLNKRVESLESDADSMLPFLRNIKKEKTYTAAGGHSSTLDKIELFIPAGCKFRIYTEPKEGVTFAPNVFFTDGTSAGVGNGTINILTKDIASIGMYSSAAGTFTFEVETYPLKEDIAENAKTRRFNIACSKELPNIDTSKRVMTFKGCELFIGDAMYSVGDVSLSLDGAASSIKSIWFNLETQSFSIADYSQYNNRKDLFRIGVIVATYSADGVFTGYKFGYFPFDFTVDGYTNKEFADVIEKSSSITFTATGSHSSTKDNLQFYVPKGTPFIPTLSKVPSNNAFYAFFADGTNSFIYSNNEYIFDKDLVSLGLYVAEAGTYTISAKVVTLKDRIIALEDVTNTKKLESELRDLVKPNDSNGVGSGNEICNILYFSDIHSNESALQRIVEFKNEWSEYINDILCGGDTLADQWKDAYIFDNVEGADKILVALGNHDNWDSANTEGDSIGGRVQPTKVFNRYFKNGASNWGAIFPTTAAQVGQCYYYKDYPNSKLRLIVLDCMNWNEGQNGWFYENLFGAKDKGYHVVVANHYAPSTNFNMITECTFCSKYWDGLNEAINPQALQTLQAAIDNGLIFIAWLFGHFHTDVFGNCVDYPMQYAVAIDKATNTGGWECDSMRWNKDKFTIDCFNIMSFDTTSGTMTIKRIGNNRDKYMRYKNYLTFDYINKKIIGNS